MAYPETAPAPRWFSDVSCPAAFRGVAILVRTLAAALALSSALVMAGCSKPEPLQRQPGPLRIVVTLPPLLGIARSLAPAGSEVHSIMPAGASEHTYEPPPGAIAQVVNADVVVMVGLGLEARVEAALLKHDRQWRRVVVFAEVVGLEGSGSGDSEAIDSGAHEHNHADQDEPVGAGGQSHDHHHHGPDPHLWLDPSLVERLIPAVRRAIESAQAATGPVSAEERARFDASERSLIEEARAVDAEFRAALEATPNRVIVTHHDAFSRLAERYGLEVAAVIRPIHVVEPTPADVAGVVAAIRNRGARVVFVEPQYSQAAAGRIAAMTGARILTLDALGDGDWAAMMRSNLKSLVEGLATPAAPATP